MSRYKAKRRLMVLNISLTVYMTDPGGVTSLSEALRLMLIKISAAAC